MRAPAPKRSTDEIVTEIIEILDAPEFEALVRKMIDYLLASCLPFIGNRRDNKDRLKELRERTTKYKKMLGKIPEPLRTALFSPEFFGSLFALGVVPGAALEVNPQTRDYLRQRKPVRLTHLVEMLDWLCTQCDQAIQHNLGTHGRVNYQKQLAANASRDVLETAINHYSQKKLSFADLDDSDYCRIASLFFEAMTGKYNCSLRRQCRNVAPR
jgi:hypothetical protein